MNFQERYKFTRFMNFYKNYKFFKKFTKPITKKFRYKIIPFY